jgi:hypothetical protein
MLYKLNLRIIAYLLSIPSLVQAISGCKRYLERPNYSRNGATGNEDTLSAIAMSAPPPDFLCRIVLA